MMIQSDELIFFRGGSTTNQVTMLNELWLVMANEKTSQSDVATSPEWCARGGGYNYFHKIAAKWEPYFGDQHDINMLDVPSGYLT